MNKTLKKQLNEIQTRATTERFRSHDSDIDVWYTYSGSQRSESRVWERFIKLPHQFGFMSIISISVPHCDLQNNVLLITQRNHRHTILPERRIWAFNTLHTNKETFYTDKCSLNDKQSIMPCNRLLISQSP